MLRRLAAVWCVVIIMSGCASNQPAGHTQAVNPSPTPGAVTGSPSQSSRPGPPSAEPQRTNVTVVMNGDLLWHNTLWYGAREDARRHGKGGYDFAPLLAGIKPVISSADLAICHEEVLRQAGRTETIRCSPLRRTL